LSAPAHRQDTRATKVAIQLHRSGVLKWHPATVMVIVTRLRRWTVARKALSVAEAKATLSDAIREVEAGGTVMITRHGKPVAALVRAEDLERLELLRAAGPEQGLASVAGGWEGIDELVQSITSAARRGRRRAVPLD
jgi:prevent-host-death family protein